MKSKPASPMASYDDLPMELWPEIFKYLSVSDLESLSATCWTLNMMIKGNFITSMDFPFHSNFISEVSGGTVLEKKPLLRLRCKKSRKAVCPTSLSSQYDEDQNMHWLMMETTLQLSTYLCRTQMSLLSLRNLRELDLVPQSFRGSFNLGELNEVEVNQYLLFDRLIFEELSTLGVLSRLSRLGVLLDQNMFLQVHFVNVVFNRAPGGLGRIVSRSLAPHLQIVVVKETRRKMYKPLSSSVVERLELVAPCTFNALLFMKNLRELHYETRNLYGRSGENSLCYHWTAKAGDTRLQHRDGLCCVDFSPIMLECPKLRNFGQIDLKELSTAKYKDKDKWFNEAKRRFFKKYLRDGGNLTMATWAKRRWVKKGNVKDPSVLRYL